MDSGNGANSTAMSLTEPLSATVVQAAPFNPILTALETLAADSVVSGGSVASASTVESVAANASAVRFVTYFVSRVEALLAAQTDDGLAQQINYMVESLSAQEQTDLLRYLADQLYVTNAPARLYEISRDFIRKVYRDELYSIVAVPPVPSLTTYEAAGSLRPLVDELYITESPYRTFKVFREPLFAQSDAHTLNSSTQSSTQPLIRSVYRAVLNTRSEIPS
jgi:hypothetical protein